MANAHGHACAGGVANPGDQPSGCRPRRRHTAGVLHTGPAAPFAVSSVDLGASRRRGGEHRACAPSFTPFVPNAFQIARTPCCWWSSRPSLWRLLIFSRTEIMWVRLGAAASMSQKGLAAITVCHPSIVLTHVLARTICAAAKTRRRRSVPRRASPSS